MRSPSPVHLVAALSLVMLLAGSAHADAVDVQLRHAVWKGREKLAVIVTANETIKGARLALRGHNGAKVDEKLGPTRAGTVTELTFSAPVGTTHFEGTLTIVFGNGKEGAMPLTFSAEVVDEFTIDVPADKVDLVAGTLEVRLGRNAGYCEHEVLYEGHSPVSAVTRFDGEAPGTPLPLTWRIAGMEGLVLRITLRCYDAGEVFDTGIELYPWKLEIEHEDVVFDSGRWDIKDGESKKLVHSYDDVRKAVERYGRWIKGVKLYVAGHTDTVGAKDYNLDLSLKRARAIAQYFRRLGVTVPVLYAGFGEDVPASPTADETPMEANRRAEYIISVNEPSAARWQGL